MDKITIEGNSIVTINSGASVLATEKITIKGTANISGKVEAAVIDMSNRTHVNLNSEAAQISGVYVTLGNAIANNGGSIVASGAEDSFVKFDYNGRLKDVTLESKNVTFKEAMYLKGDTKVSGIKTLNIDSLLSVEGAASFENDYVDHVIFAGDTWRRSNLDLVGSHVLKIGTLDVNEDSRLLDRMNTTTEGVTSFSVDTINVTSDKTLSIASLASAKFEDGTEWTRTGEATSLTIGTLNVDDKAKVELGWDSEGGDGDQLLAFKSKTIDTLNMGTESVIDGGSSDASKFADIKSQFQERNATPVIIRGSDYVIDSFFPDSF